MWPYLLVLAVTGGGVAAIAWYEAGRLLAALLADVRADPSADRTACVHHEPAQAARNGGECG